MPKDEKYPQKTSELLEAAKPLLKYLNENYHPHVTVLVTPVSVELLEGLISIPKFYDYVRA